MTSAPFSGLPGVEKYAVEGQSYWRPGLFHVQAFAWNEVGFAHLNATCEIAVPPVGFRLEVRVQEAHPTFRDVMDFLWSD